MSAPLPAELPILPFTRPAAGGVTLPGSKSLTNRALLLAALGDQPVELRGALFSEDTEIMTGALRDLGIAVEADAAARTVDYAQFDGEPEQDGGSRSRLRRDKTCSGESGRIQERLLRERFSDHGASAVPS